MLSMRLIQMCEIIIENNPKKFRIITQPSNVQFEYRKADNRLTTSNIISSFLTLELNFRFLTQF